MHHHSGAGASSGTGSLQGARGSGRCKASVMHACFHGGACDGRVAKAIRAFAGSVKAMSGGGGDHARPRRRWRRRPEADSKDVAATSAKIAPAQLQDEGDDEHHEEEEKCCSSLFNEDGGAKEEEEAAESGWGGEWVAEPEPGVEMTLAPLPDGTNRLRAIRFRQALFDAWAAQSWWADNYDRVVELYSLVYSGGDDDDAATSAAVPVTPCQSESDEEEELPDGAGSASSSPSPSNFSGGQSSGSGSSGTVGSPILGLVTVANTSGGATTTTINPDADVDDDPTVATPWREWVEEYEPGVFVTVRAYPDRRLQLRRVELSRERFGEVKARVWWQENKAKLHHLYS